MFFLPTQVELKHMDVFCAIADGLVHEVSPEVIANCVDQDFPKDELNDYVRTVTKPSQIPGFRSIIEGIISRSNSNSIGQFALTMNMLLLRILAFPLTGSSTLLTEMSDDEKMKVLLSWRNSPLELLNKLFHMTSLLTMVAFQRLAPDIHFRAMGYPRTEEREVIYEGYVKNEYVYTMLDPPATDNVELYVPQFDAVIIGSGSGSGVVAHTLARAGHKTLVLEKGKYFKQDDLVFDDEAGYNALYESGGSLSTNDASAMILAGATFGGGSTVNWSACLKTPFKVRKEWYDDYGVEWVANETYDNHQDYVLKQMGASTENINHSFTNSMLLDGCAKLGYSAKEVPQNNGGHTDHSCGYCHLGCKWGIKQGSMASWFRDAAEHGAEFMDQVMVEEIIRNKSGHAIGLRCLNTRNGFKFVIRGPRKFIVSAGSLHTPIVLKNSGFRNSHIGKNLKLHPITALTGVWDHKSNPQHHSIMTSVCTQAEDMDGKAHGAKIETLLHVPFLESAFIPYDNSDQARQDLLKYQGSSTFIILTRDTLSGTVSNEKDRPEVLNVDYTVNKTDRANMVASILVSLDIMYIEGALEIIHPYWKVKRFTSSKPKHERNINDKDYQKWRKLVENTQLPTYGPGYGSAHQMSTCRMSGNGPKQGACDLKGRLYESDNVYVADASVMPTASGSNPMVTTMAMARHVALGIAKELLPSARL